MMAPARRDERGSATLISLGLAGVLVVVAFAGATVAGLLVGHRRAAVAADLAALAAAESVPSPGRVESTGAPCEVAEKVGMANGARMTSCTVEGEEVSVSVAVSVPVLVGMDVAVAGRARAGPVSRGQATPSGE